MRRWGAWSLYSGNDVGVAQNRPGSPLKCGHANVLGMIKIGLYPMPTFCGAGVDASQRRTNGR
jgi:hypothetical protein